MDNVYSAYHYLQKCIKEVLKAKQHVEEAKQYAEEAKKAADGSGRATITYWDDVDAQLCTEKKKASISP